MPTPQPMPVATNDCPWPLDTTCCSDWDNYDPAIQQAAMDTATEVVWALSGRQFTTCETTVRPCRANCGMSCDSCGWGMGWGNGSWIGSAPAFTPWLFGGQWFNLSCPCSGGCSCGQFIDEFDLPSPAAWVTAVYVDGAPFTAWALYDQHRLIRTDGERWPRCQDLTKDLTEEGTWGVTFVRGTPVPPAGQRAAGVLACEIAKACIGAKCRLPALVTNVSRDGLTYTIDPTGFFEKGFTGLAEVDLWLAAVNPSKNVRRSGVYTPENLRRESIRNQPGEVFPT